MSAPADNTYEEVVDYEATPEQQPNTDVAMDDGESPANHPYDGTTSEVQPSIAAEPLRGIHRSTISAQPPIVAHPA